MRLPMAGNSVRSYSSVHAGGGSEPKDGKRKRRQKISSQEDSADHRAVDTSFDRADQPGGADGLYIFIIEDAG